MTLNQRDVAKIAHLARLELSEAEKALYLGQLSAILEYAAMLDELDLSSISPTTHAIAQENVLRDDIIAPSLPLEETLYNAPKQQDNQFLIQSVLE